MQKPRVVRVCKPRDCLLADGKCSELAADYYCKKCGFSWGTGSLTGVDVQKIRFKYWANFGCCDKNSDELGKDVCEFTGDGKVKHLVYPVMGKKVLYNDVFMDVCDGESYEMTVTYIDGRKKKVNGDVDCTEIDEAVF